MFYLAELHYISFILADFLRIEKRISTEKVAVCLDFSGDSVACFLSCNLSRDYQRSLEFK